MIRTLTWLLLASTLAGCGFELRGQMVLPSDIRQIHVQGPAVLKNEIEVALSGTGVAVAEERAAADAVLAIESDRFNRRVLSVDPDTGKEREFELVYVVSFRATRGNGEMLLEGQRVNLLRDYVFDADAVIGKSREEGVLRQEMRRDAAQQILRRLESALNR